MEVLIEVNIYALELDITLCDIKFRRAIQHLMENHLKTSVFAAFYLKFLPVKYL